MQPASVPNRLSDPPSRPDRNRSDRIRPSFTVACAAFLALAGTAAGADDPFPGPRGQDLDTASRADFRERDAGGFLHDFVKVPRDRVVGFALYTHDRGVLKMSAIVNSYYGRWWWPEDERPGAHPIPGSPLPWTGDYLDGLYNRITMVAYANPSFDSIQSMRRNQRDARANLGDGHGLVRFDKRTGTISFEAWPRNADLADGDAAQYPGWPVTFAMEENDGREVHGHLPELQLIDPPRPVVQIVREDDGEILYTRRIRTERFRPPVYAPGRYTVKVGPDKPDAWSIRGLEPR